MRVKRFEWEGPGDTASKLRFWPPKSAVERDVSQIGEEVFAGRDAAVLRLTEQLDATEKAPDSLRVDLADAQASLATIDPELRESLELAAANVRAVAEAQSKSEPQKVVLTQGQAVTIRELPVGAAGIYAPGGKAAYPSSVLMCAIPARVAGVERLSLASPPGPDGQVAPAVLAAAALCEVDDIYAMGGAQSIYALAYGTETVKAVNVIAGPGNAWVQGAKRAVSDAVGIDSYAGPSELMVVADSRVSPDWIALDLCAQAEHGIDGPLVAVAVDAAVLDAVEAAVKDAAARRAGVEDAYLGLVSVPDPESAIALANAYAPEHLELLADQVAELSENVTTAGCVFVGPYSATAFGDYVAGSNHVLPTGGAGRFSGPLGPDVFRRKIATVEVPPEAASKLAPHVDTIARAEGFPVHGESAMIRAEEDAR